MDLPQLQAGVTLTGFETRDAMIPINEHGNSVFLARFQGPGVADNDSLAMLSYDPTSGLSVVARAGQLAPELGPGGRLRWYSCPTLNNAGQVAFIATHEYDDPKPAPEIGIWTGAPNNLHLVAKTGDPAPGVDGTFSRLSFPNFSYPVINAQGSVAFSAAITGPDVDETNDTGIWAQDPDGTLHLIVREGQLGPSEFERHDFAFQRIYFNSRGQVAFTLDGGIWATDLAGNIHSIIQFGDPLPFHHGFTDVPSQAPVLFVATGPSTGNEEGLGPTFNDRGELAFYAYSQGNNIGIFLSREVAVPEPTAAMLALVPVIALAAFGPGSAAALHRINRAVAARRRPSAVQNYADFSSVPSWFSLLYSVFRLIPSWSAAFGLLPPVRSRASWIASISISRSVITPGRLPGGADELPAVEPLRQVLAADRAAVAEDRGVLDHVGQLADVARPDVAAERRDRVLGDQRLARPCRRGDAGPAGAGRAPARRRSARAAAASGSRTC